MSREPANNVYVVAADEAMTAELRALFASVQMRTQCFSSVAGLLEALTPADRGCIVADAATTGADAADMRERLHTIDSTLPIIYLCAGGNVSMAVQALKGGAADFLEVPYNDQTLLDAVNDAVHADRQTEREQRHRRGIFRRFAGLTPREWELLIPIARGWTNRQVAGRFGVSEKTVEAYRGRIIRKTNARNLPGLMRMALRAGLLDDDRRHAAGGPRRA